jgi:hypothetical protein
MEMVVRERVEVQGPDFYCGGIFKLVPRWYKCSVVPGDYV